jgi:hypothetical protein
MQCTVCKQTFPSMYYFELAAPALVCNDCYKIQHGTMKACPHCSRAMNKDHQFCPSCNRDEKGNLSAIAAKSLTDNASREQTKDAVTARKKTIAKVVGWIGAFLFAIIAIANIHTIPSPYDRRTVVDSALAFKEAIKAGVPGYFLSYFLARAVLFFIPLRSQERKSNTNSSTQSG